MGSSNAGDRKQNDFTALVEAMNLAAYVDLITDNLKVFPDYSKVNEKDSNGNAYSVYVQKSSSLTNWVVNQTRKIFILTYSANRINLNKQPERKKERLDKECQAIELCYEHLAAIQLCKRRFHLSSKRIKYWGGRVRNLIKLLESWNESDKTRYKNI